MPPSIVPLEVEDDAPATLALEYREPPVERLPQPLADYVAQSAEAIGCDPSLIAMPALAAVAAAIGDSRSVEVKVGWREFPVLWTLAVAPSGALKTPAMKAAMEGLEVAQRKAFEAHRLAEETHQAALADWIKREKPGPAHRLLPLRRLRPARPPLRGFSEPG